MMDEIRPDPITAGFLLAWKLPTERALEMVLQPLVPVRAIQAQILSILRAGVASVAWAQPGARDAIAAHAFKALVRVGASAESTSPSAFALFETCVAAAGATMETAARSLASPPFDVRHDHLRGRLFEDLVRAQAERVGRAALAAAAAIDWAS